MKTKLQLLITFSGRRDPSTVHRLIYCPYNLFIIWIGENKLSDGNDEYAELHVDQ